MPVTAPFDPLKSSAVLTVSQLNDRIKRLLEANFPYVWVRGEVSNLKIPASGHAYFTLKDERSQIRVVMFRSAYSRLKFRPEDGMAVLCQGRLTVYEPRGDYQVIADILEPEGLGALQKAFEQLKEKLHKEGLFDQQRKRPLPARPQRVAVITSSSGAAIRDILKVFQQCPYPLTVTLLPVRVQGTEAAPEIAQALETVSRLQDRFAWDVVIVGRGGGSLEDLWPFNEEVVARAIARCTVPVISAVGHEIDLTISDLVADYRAPTPTAGAQWVVSRLEDLERHLADRTQRLRSALLSLVEHRRNRMRRLEARLKDPRRQLIDWRLALDERLDRLTRAMQQRLYLYRLRKDHLEQRLQRLHPAGKIAELRLELESLARQLLQLHQQSLRERRLKLGKAAGKLESLSPLSILSRGYSITYKLPEKKVVTDAARVHPGDELLIQLAQGEVTAEVVETKKGPG
ncbi:Exodeoxyribonuclease VII large subunit [Desulfacinum hydrothermale DSM 13146]|uniref:Exodeoxyribonuclease 7 large subunit n=1 Tax=Desulfacinum hydrothermale DSM 13146 TaxID=1121390 RepID=A0A1W1XF67_9BACT|nr:exodeoxyribonuclease VII large subunit [Desulfacinum hydrothermale]SMC22462.1 Exodeoxyribonuclease VII large subunit [Desulfacinum hydrothermale DSM 13146]